MALIVWAACASHTSAMIGIQAKGDEVVGAERVYAGWSALRESLRRAAPDVLVIIATDHFRTFSRETVPAFAIGVGEHFRTWGDGYSHVMELHGIAGLGERVGASMIDDDIDIALCADMPIDHSFGVPLEFLAGREPNINILPLFINCALLPIPTIKRSYAMGTALGRALRKQGAAARVALLGSGGLSHWVGVPNNGSPVNVPFDRTFLDGFTSGQVGDLLAIDPETLLVDAGNGSAEIRNWLAVEAATRARFREVVYEPMSSWITGIGMVEAIGLPAC
jgi:hypothetical protein